MAEDSGRRQEYNWSQAVDDLVNREDVDGASSVLDSVVSRLQTLDSVVSRLQTLDSFPSSSSAPATGNCGGDDDDDLRLTAAVDDLGNLRARSLLVRTRPDDCDHHSPPPSAPAPETRAPEQAEEKIAEKEETRVPADDDDDDWEAIADRALPDVGVSRAPQDDQTVAKITPRRRGRGSFFYKKDVLYSDQADIGGVPGDTGSDSEEESGSSHGGENSELRKSRFGTSHVLVLYDFSPDTRTADLEKLYEGFKDRGFAIRWVNDTSALAVFRSPAIAKEAGSVCCPFKVRGIDENDSLLSKLSAKDLEPPYPRPKTSVRTAQRLIAQGMGLKLQTDFSLKELRVQEEARKNRIHTRQTTRDDAWGSDDP